MDEKRHKHGCYAALSPLESPSFGANTTTTSTTPTPSTTLPPLPPPPHQHGCSHHQQYHNYTKLPESPKQARPWQSKTITASYPMRCDMRYATSVMRVSICNVVRTLTYHSQQRIDQTNSTNYFYRKTAMVGVITSLERSLSLHQENKALSIANNNPKVNKFPYFVPIKDLCLGSF